MDGRKAEWEGEAQSGRAERHKKTGAAMVEMETEEESEGEAKRQRWTRSAKETPSHALPAPHGATLLCLLARQHDCPVHSWETEMQLL